MDAINTINIIAKLYKQELAEANHQKVLIQAQCEIYKQQIDMLKKEIEELKSTDKIDN
jgi:prefoldin subunit 5